MPTTATRTPVNRRNRILLETHCSESGQLSMRARPRELESPLPPEETHVSSVRVGEGAVAAYPEGRWALMFLTTLNTRTRMATRIERATDSTG